MGDSRLLHHTLSKMTECLIHGGRHSVNPKKQQDRWVKQETSAQMSITEVPLMVT